MKIYKWVQISSNEKKKKNRSDNKENDQSLDTPHFGDDSNTCKLIQLFHHL